ncbi:hypothetical protein LTR36_007110 [Oleoguttula mirabilis]|uniref:Uncharacterized protein n=1 Tax=Oleoguttula mirabilis TaxID=1507867 RepID=A0AAV9JB96_9PEZI|nr:hypothetical protein LTR36_007110 [Oleoguttula mirabilis]
MQYTTIIVSCLAIVAGASAQLNGTVTPAGTATVGTASASGTGAASATTSPIDNGAASAFSGSALGLILAGGVALAL